MSLFLFTFLPTYFAEPVRPSFVLERFFIILFSYIPLIKTISVTSLDIVIPSLAIFGFVLLYYYFCDMFILHSVRFFQRSRLQKIRLIRIIDTNTEKKIPTVKGPKEQNGQILKITDL